MSEKPIWVGVITLFPEYFHPLQHHGVVARGLSQGCLTLDLEPLRRHGKGIHRRVDDRPYGGGAGMVLQPGPLKSALEALQSRSPEKARVVFLSPQGVPLTQNMLKTQAQAGPLILIAGRYEGADQRFIDRWVDETWSVGDFVMSGGELPAMMVVDGLARLAPGVLQNPDSTAHESFSEGRLGHPQYTRPPCFEGMEVPPCLQSGNHHAIAQWREQAALLQTVKKRPDLVKNAPLTAQEICFLEQIGVQYPSIKP